MDALRDVLDIVLGVLKDPKYGVPAGALGLSLLVILVVRGLADPIATIIRALRKK